MALQPPEAKPTAQDTERRRQLAYLALFGNAGTRTTDQEIVMRDIEHFAYAHRLVTEKDNLNRIDPKSAEFNDGRRSVWLRIRGAIILAMAAPPVLKVSRQRKAKSV